jgi:hypothetical protein
MADLIVLGDVATIEESTFQFHVNEFLENHHASRSLKVEKYIPPEFIAPRAQPYATGQCFILFLIKPDPNKTDQPWKILGIAGEGEMPIEDEYVYFNGKRLIFSVIHNPRPAMSDFPNDSIFGIIYDINRKQHRSRFLAPSHHAMASVWVIPSKLLPSASAAYSPV